MTNSIEITTYLSKGVFGNVEHCEFTFYKDLPEHSSLTVFHEYAYDQAIRHDVIIALRSSGWFISGVQSSLSARTLGRYQIYKNHNQGSGAAQQHKYHWRAISGNPRCGSADTIAECEEQIINMVNENA